MAHEGEKDAPGGAGWGRRAAKRFYKTVTARPADQAGLCAVFLDDRMLKTPGGAPVAAPLAVAAAIVAEWDAVESDIDPKRMPATRAVNTAIERIAPARDAVISEISGYGSFDAICQRAVSPEGLVARETSAWDPWVAWADREYGARLRLAQGVAPGAQPPEALARLRAQVASRSDLGLAALSDLTALSGSLVLALAVDVGAVAPEDAWRASRVEELWQIEQWGEDSEAAARDAQRFEAFDAAARLSALLRVT